MTVETDLDLLLVEDSSYDAELAVRTLEKLTPPPHVFVVRDGAQALEFLFRTGRYANRPERVRPKLVLLDLKLPKVDGLEVLRQVKADEQTRTIPVVVFSSSREHRDIQESYQLGVNSYLVKPLDFDRYVACVSEVARYWLLSNEPPVR